jgi:hypothetical protein
MIIQQLFRRGDGATGAQEYISGKESTADPSAPATKTLALIEQAFITIGEGITRFREYAKVPQYNRIEELFQYGDPIMEYRVMDKKAGALWKEMNRDDLAKRADYQLRGKAEDLDKVTREQNAIGLAKTMMEMFPEVAERPESRRILAKNVLDAYNHPERDLIIPSEEQLYKERVRATREALKQLAQAHLIESARRAEEAAQQKMGDAGKALETMKLIGAKQTQMAEQMNAEIEQGQQTPPAGGTK